jgi:hypothetical protein
MWWQRKRRGTRAQKRGPIKGMGEGMALQPARVVRGQGKDG